MRGLAACVALVLAIGVDSLPLHAAGHRRIALFVDNSDVGSTALLQMRSALPAFVDSLPAEDEVLLVSTGRRAQTRVQPTLDRKKIKDSIAGLTPERGPTPLMDALIEVDGRFMRKGDFAPVFVILTGDGTESSATTDEKTFSGWLTSLPTRHAMVGAIVIKVKGSGVPEQVATAATQASGGYFTTIGSGAGLADKLAELARKITAP
jgi:von Willebrand factor type A domain